MAESKRNRIASKATHVETQTVTFTFLDPEGNPSGDPIVAKLSDLSETIRTQLALHGLSQKLGDSYAGAESLEAARGSVTGTLQQLVNGTWTQRSSGGGSKTSDLAEAVAQLKNAPVEDVAAKLAQLSDEDVKAIRANAKVKAIMAEIKAKRAAEKARAAKKDAKDAGDLDLAI